MKHKAHVLNTAIMVLVLAAAAAAQPTDILQLRVDAEQGYANAQYNLGVMYTKGEGVPQDYVQAHTWINLAASRTTTGKAGDHRLARDLLADRMMTASQVAEAQRLAQEWQPKTWEQLTGK